MFSGRVLVLAAVALSAQACAGISVSRQFDPDVDFSAYRSYDWMPTERRRVDLRARDPLIEQRIRDAIEMELGAKGLQKVPPEEADIRIGYLLVLEESVDAQEIYTGAAPNWQYRTYGPGTTTQQTRLLTTGTLLIDVFDAGKNEMVWRGVAEGQVKEIQDPEKRRARINEAVGKILAEFPPKG
jgi:hypothetical protein